MTVQEFLTNSAILFGVMGLVSLIEMAVPLVARDERAKRRGIANIGLSVVTLTLNWLLISATAVLALSMSLRDGGLLSHVALPSAAQFTIALLALDLFGGYLSHVTMHAIPMLWRVHRVHHSDPFVDVTSTLRQHPIETVWRAIWTTVPVWLLGLSPAVVVAYRMLSATNAILEHANVSVGVALDRALSLVWGTPNMHKVHHSSVRIQTNSNYGNIFSIYDRLFRTFTPTNHGIGVRYGLDDADPQRAKAFVALLAMRFDRSASSSTRGETESAATSAAALSAPGRTSGDEP